MTFRDIKASFELAGDRLRWLLGDPWRAARVAGSRVSQVVRPSHVLTEEQRVGISEFANAEALSDRAREFSFEAVDPATGRRGQYRTSVNRLLIIEAGYDVARRELEALLDELVRDGLLTWDKPAIPPNIADLQVRGGLGSWGDGNPSYAGANDSRMWTGGWADWPNYAGLVNPGYDEAATAINYTRFSSGPFLPGTPLPRDWRRIYPTRKIFDKRAFGNEAFVSKLSDMTRWMALLINGANGNVEWHPAVVYFNNGVPAPYFQNGVWDNVDLRYQYKNIHPWMVPTVNASPGNAGLRPVGASDPLWRESMNTRSPRYWAEHHSPIGRHNWAELHYADAVSNFVQTANLASFVLGLGATAHVHACVEHHAAVVQKAYTELGEPLGAGIDGYLLRVAREREAREVRASQAASGGTNLALVSGPTSSPDRMVVNQVLNGLVVASAQLFVVSPIIGGVALLVVGVGIFVANLILGRAYECHGERLLVRDGRSPVREVDINECTGTQGDLYGGNYVPHIRENAIHGRPMIRVKDSLGRDL